MTTAHRVEERAKRTTLWYGLVLDDPHPPPEHLRERFPYEPRSTQIPVSRYTSREWHELERKHLWRKVWQMACREENIPDVGSYIVYDIAGDSYLVVRTRDGIKAYVNACLHRGRALKDYDGRCSEFRCSFHGFTWRLDGSLRYTPAPAEFPEIEANRDDWRLPEAKVGRVGRVRLHQPRSGRRTVRGVPGHVARPLRPLGLRAPVSPGPRGEEDPVQLEDSSGGVRRGAAPGRDPSPVGPVRRRRQRRGRRLRQLFAADQPVRHADRGHARRGATRRTSSSACWTCARERTCPSPSRSAAPPATRWPRPGGTAGARCSATRRMTSATPNSSITGTTRCSRTCTPGAGTTGSCTGSGPTATGTTSRSSR